MEGKDVLSRMRTVSDVLKASIRDAKEQRKALDIVITAKMEDEDLVNEAIREIEATITEKEIAKKDAEGGS